MKRDNLEEQWYEISQKLRGRFSKLTVVDLNFIKGKEEDLLNRIQERLGKTRLEVLTLIGTL